MASLGFTTYVSVTPTPPTLEDILASLSAQQKLAVLEAFAEKVFPIDFRQWMKVQYPALSNQIPREAVKALYLAIDDVEEFARTEMRGERLISEAEYDDQGVETVPAVYNDVPADQPALLAAAVANMDTVFTSAQINAVLNKMVEYSSKDESGNANGTWAIYSAEVIK